MTIKTHISILLLILTPLFLLAQGLRNEGAAIVITSGATVYIDGGTSGDYTNTTNSTDGRINIDGSLVVEGDWTNNASNNVFISRDTDGEVEFKGGAAQSIGGSAETMFEKVKINNSAANVSLTVNATIEATLTLTTNDLVLGSKTLSLGSTSADATITGGSATTYIQADGTGVVKYFHKTAAKDYIYPVGCASYYTPFTFNTGTSTLTNAYTTLKVTNAVHPNKGAQANYLTRYWTLEPSGITNINYEVSYVYNEANDVVGTESEIVPKKYSSSAWTAGTTINEATNTLSWTGLTSFSDFSGFNDDALPVEFLSFDVKLVKTPRGASPQYNVDLTWQTATEINNDYFEIQRMDNDQWDIITTINGAGNSNTTTDYQYTDNPHIPTSSHPHINESSHHHIIYYRLKQVDFNGKYSYSEIKSVTINPDSKGAPTLTAWYTGNTEQKIQYVIESVDENQITANLYDIMGRIVATQNTSILKGHNESSISTNKLPKGQYLLYISGTGSHCGYPNINLKKKITIY